MRQIKRDRIDSDKEIEATATYNAIGLASLHQSSNFEVVRGFSGPFIRKFNTLDGEWSLIIIGNEDEISRWNCRKILVGEMLDILDRNRARICSPEFNWDQVIGAMAWLLALFEASQQTLELNKENDGRGEVST